jgi:large subunit ribosomal protein L14
MRLNSQSINWLNTSRSLHLGQPLREIQLLTRLRVVDNSPIGKQAMMEGRPPKCIHVYNKTGVGTIGLSI